MKSFDCEGGFLLAEEVGLCFQAGFVSSGSPGHNVTKHFTAVIHEFSHFAKAFVHGKHFKPGLTNILA
jgi:hypothetical protein